MKRFCKRLCRRRDCLPNISRGTRICKKLGWNDLEFVFTDVDSGGDVMEEAQIQALLLQNGVLTVAEVRRMRGLPPL